VKTRKRQVQIPLDPDPVALQSLSWICPFPADSYRVHYSDTTINLFTIGDQRILDVHFPMISESETHTDMEDWAYWTNHPECVTRTWIEEITNSSVEGVPRWRHIEFDLTGLLEVEGE